MTVKKIIYRICLPILMLVAASSVQAQLKLEKIPFDLNDILGKTKILKVKKGFNPIFSLGNYQINTNGILGEKLKGVNIDLVSVVHRALELSDIDFAVTEGLRTKERQAELVKAGASKTMNSRHITGHAVDLAAIVGSVLGNAQYFAQFWQFAHHGHNTALELRLIHHSSLIAIPAAA